MTGAGYICGAGTTCTFTSNIIIELGIRDPLNAVVHSKSLSPSPPSLPDEPPIRSYSDSYSLSSALLSGTFQVNARASWNGYPTVQASSSFQLEGTATTAIAVPSWGITVSTDKGSIPIQVQNHSFQCGDRPKAAVQILPPALACP